MHLIIITLQLETNKTNMKKVLLLTFAMLALATVAIAQPRAIGARFGGHLGVSYEHTVGENMVSVDLSLPCIGWGLEAVATYDWLNPGGITIPWEEKGEWNWYAGVGAGAGFYGYRNIEPFVGAAGRIGIEYNFWFPLQLSFDFRPLLGIEFDNTYGVLFNGQGVLGLELGVRYLF